MGWGDGRRLPIVGDVVLQQLNKRRKTTTKNNENYDRKKREVSSWILMSCQPHRLTPEYRMQNTESLLSMNKIEIFLTTA